MATYNPDELAHPDKPVTDEQIRLVAHELQGRSWEGVMESSFRIPHNHITSVQCQIGQYRPQEDIISEVLHKWKNNTGIVTGRQMFENFQKAYIMYTDLPIDTLKTILIGSLSEIPPTTNMSDDLDGGADEPDTIESHFSGLSMASQPGSDLQLQRPSHDVFPGHSGRTSVGGTGFPIQVTSAQFHNTHPKTDDFTRQDERETIVLHRGSSVPEDYQNKHKHKKRDRRVSDPPTGRAVHPESAILYERASGPPQILFVLDKWQDGCTGLHHFNRMLLYDVRRVVPVGSKQLKVSCAVLENDDSLIHYKPDAEKLGIQLVGYKRQFGQKPRHEEMTWVKASFHHIKTTIGDVQVVVGHYPQSNIGVVNIVERHYPEAKIIMFCHQPVRSKKEVCNTLVPTAVFSIGDNIKSYNSTVLRMWKGESTFLEHAMYCPVAPLEYLTDDAAYHLDDIDGTSMHTFCDFHNNKDMREDVLNIVVEAYEERLRYREEQSRSWNFRCNSERDRKVIEKVKETLTYDVPKRRIIISAETTPDDDRTSDPLLNSLQIANLSIVIPRDSHQINLEPLYAISMGIPVLFEDEQSLAKFLLELNRDIHLMVVQSGRQEDRLPLWKGALRTAFDTPTTLYRICRETRNRLLQDKTTAQSRYSFLRILFGAVGYEMRSEGGISVSKARNDREKDDITDDITKQLQTQYYLLSIQGKWQDNLPQTLERMKVDVKAADIINSYKSLEIVLV